MTTHQIPPQASTDYTAKPCFVICPFGPPESQQRKRSNMLLEYVITPAVREHGYAVVRADLSAEPGIVTVHVIQHLIEDALLVADITDHNPNVFYELAIRHSIRKPFIQVIREGDKIPFNIQGVQTVEYDLQDPDKIRRAIEKIRNQITYYETTKRVTSPVSVAIDAIVNVAGVEQFQAIMDRLEMLDSGVSAVEQVRQQIVDEVKAVLAEIKQQVDSQVWARINEIDRHLERSNTLRGRHLPDYNSTLDDPFSNENQKVNRRGRGEFTIGEWIDIQNRGGNK